MSPVSAPASGADAGLENRMAYWACLLLILVPLLVEREWLRRHRGDVPVRIHVHGTRGKSGATRAIAAHLEAGGLRVLAKTTGDRAEYLLPGGGVAPLRRVGPARIQEHVRLLRKAVALGADVVVAEGMALQPETVYQSERMLQATHAVVVNTRPDHAETMGPGREGVVQTLQHMFPCNGTLFTAAEAGAERLQALAAGAGVPCVVVDAPAMAQAGALARAVAGAVLATREGLPGRADAPGPATPGVEAARFGMPVRGYDLLSANDVLSSRWLLDGCAPRAGDLRVALLATRADRPLRTRAFVDWLLAEPRFDAVAVLGGHAGYAVLRGGLRGAFRRFLPVWPGLAPDRLCRALVAAARRRDRSGLTVVALGNVHGYGERWRAELDRWRTEPGQGAEHAG